GMHMLGGSVPVYGINVCDDEAYFLNKVSADLQAWQHTYPEAAQGIVQSEIKINVIDGYVGRGYGIADTPVFETIRELATVEGVVLDPVYTGKAFNGLLQEIDQGRFANASNIVFVHTGGIFGLFPFADALFR
ncbi:MAG: pyridoxal-phosphate dependent enzyme, partial [Gammaproteobacteria bacterium]|nr:pyridoxal-phosphate dependent enzyme [Gammaproteobacteria bacterium]